MAKDAGSSANTWKVTALPGVLSLKLPRPQLVVLKSLLAAQSELGAFVLPSSMSYSQIPIFLAAISAIIQLVQDLFNSLWHTDNVLFNVTAHRDHSKTSASTIM